MIASVSKILVFRIGSIGDFVIALPCFHLIRRAYPKAEIVLLTNLPARSGIMPAETVLQGSKLVDRYIRYRGGTRNPRQLRALREEINSLAPDMLVYLTEPRGGLSVYRDYLFFRWCGIRRFVGLEPFQVQGWLLPFATDELQESESLRLCRQIVSLGAIDISSKGAWDLQWVSAEKDLAATLLDGAFKDAYRARRRLLGFSCGTKQSINDWGDDNWRSVLEALSSLDYGLVIIGGTEDYNRSERLASCWTGPVLNLCGQVTPRVSAAVMLQLRLFLCHDSGPMHLAAAVGTPCVAVFSRRNPPGKWFPPGTGHRIIYPTGSAASIASIHPRQVVGAVAETLSQEFTFIEQQAAQT